MVDRRLLKFFGEHQLLVKELVRDVEAHIVRARARLETSHVILDRVNRLLAERRRLDEAWRILHGEIRSARS